MMVLVVGLSAGCTRPRADYTGPASIATGRQVAVVGRVELIPGLMKSDQNIRTVLSPYEYENTMFLTVDDEPQEFREEPGNSEFQGHIPATLGQTFFKILPARKQYISLGMVILEVGGAGVRNKVWFPGHIEMELGPEDHAVYIGTIRYHRTAFFELERIEVVDEWDQAQAEFAEHFGDATRLRKRLARVVWQPEPPPATSPPGP